MSMSPFSSLITPSTPWHLLYETIILWYFVMATLENSFKRKGLETMWREWRLVSYSVFKVDHPDDLSLSCCLPTTTQETPSETSRTARGSSTWVAIAWDTLGTPDQQSPGSLWPWLLPHGTEEPPTQLSPVNPPNCEILKHFGFLNCYIWGWFSTQQ